jgi:hypothetical protein
MDYYQLFETIKGYTENDFPATSYTPADNTAQANFTSKEQIDTFIQQAEQRIFNTVQIPAIRKNVVGNLTPNNQYLTLPFDWLATFSIAVVDPETNEYHYLLDKDVNYIRQAFPFPQVVGRPTHYAQFDQNSFILGPTPDFNYVAELHYFYYPESITTALNSWLGDNFSSVLLYGALLEAYTYMKGEADVLNNYAARYNEAMALLKNLGDGKNRTDAYRTGQVRVPVR